MGSLNVDLKCETLSLLDIKTLTIVSYRVSFAFEAVTNGIPQVITAAAIGRSLLACSPLLDVAEESLPSTDRPCIAFPLDGSFAECRLLDSCA